MLRSNLATIISLLSFTFIVQATRHVQPNEYCFIGCQEAVVSLQLNFAGSPGPLDPYPLEQCLNPLMLQSIYICARLHCLEGEIEAGADYAASECEGSSLYNETTYNTIKGLSENQLAALPHLDFGYVSKDNITTSVVVSDGLFGLGYRTIRVWNTGVHHNVWYSYAMVLFWSGIVALGVASNILSKVIRMIAVRSAGKVNPQKSVLQKAWHQIQARFILPATFSHRCSVPVGQCTLPPRAEFLVILAFIMLNVILCAVSFEVFEDNLYWPVKSWQIWRYFSDRTGYLSYSNLAICWFFAIRNNILIWLTGWNFATFNRFHRWIARLAALEAVLHSIGYTVFSFKTGGFADYSMSWSQEYWYTGAIATIAMSLMIGFSVLYLRVKFYDFFLIMHIALALMTLVNLFYHTKIFSGEFDGWLWACVAFWVFDRACRIGRLVYMTILGRGIKATADFYDDARLIRVDVTEACSRAKVVQSGYFFLYSLTSLFAWESHPFTLVRWKQESADQYPSTPVSTSDCGDKLAGEKLPSLKASELSLSESATDHFSFLIRPHKGYTMKLSRFLTRVMGPRKVNFLIEGPYGHDVNLDSATDICYFIGGSGISVAITSIYSALERNPDVVIRLVWSSRSPRLIDTVLEQELALAARQANISIDAFITGGRIELRSNKVCRSIEYFRPNVPALVRSAVSNSKGHTAIVVCGPESLTDDVRAAAVEEMRNAADYAVSLHIESFNW